MLYALVMAVIFGMILSFYLSAVIDNQKNLITQKAFLSAQLMARMTQARVVKQKSGQIRFNTGISEYQQMGNVLKVTVRLENARTYHFELPNMVK
ncbi:MAG: competence type IV pilus minor pilin ComGG [Lactococcus chungangensis]|nr:competence type IV pilus minor pilin ComGG [Lactococcus chungangensis]MDD3015456.1 competence type IV pilus minor pilin ComGG [Lactococcus chungangensis]